jgi:8-oxo-dGTP pyrophosphatase MutT (NUDIX family)
MAHPNHNAVGIIWWLEKGVPMVLVVDAVTTNPKYPQEVQVKIPGGGNKRGETPIATVTREIKEEVGWRIRKRYTPVEIHEERVSPSHTKVALAIPRSACRGRLRDTVLFENDSVLGPPRPVTLKEAIDTVLFKKHNTFNKWALIRFREYLKERYGALVAV